MSNNEQIKEQHVIDLGALLQTARIKAGLTPEQIAAKLRLRKTYIELLEKNAFTELKENSTFVRGYVRSYARLVSIPKEQIDEAFALIDFKDIEPLKGTVINTTRQTREFSFQDKKIRYITYGIILLLLILVIIWWRSQVVSHIVAPVVTAPALTQSEPAAAPTTAPTVAVGTEQFPMVEKQIEAEKTKQESVLKPATAPKPEAAPKNRPAANSNVNKLNMDING